MRTNTAAVETVVQDIAEEWAWLDGRLAFRNLNAAIARARRLTAQTALVWDVTWRSATQRWHVCIG